MKRIKNELLIILLGLKFAPANSFLGAGHCPARPENPFVGAGEWACGPPLQMHFQGRFRAWPAPGNGFLGAVSLSVPEKRYF